MPIDPIAGPDLLLPATNPPGKRPVGQAAGELGDFAKLLGDAVNNLNQLDNRANDAVARLAAGENVELHQVMVAVQEADIAFQLALQVRNQLMDGYREVMRMQV